MLQALMLRGIADVQGLHALHYSLLLKGMLPNKYWIFHCFNAVLTNKGLLAVKHVFNLRKLRTQKISPSDLKLYCLRMVRTTFM